MKAEEWARERQLRVMLRVMRAKPARTRAGLDRLMVRWRKAKAAFLKAGGVMRYQGLRLIFEHPSGKRRAIYEVK